MVKLATAKLATAKLAAHSDFEGQCSRCHAPLETIQDVLCLACHTRVALQVKTQDGTHSLIKNVNQCAKCHNTNIWGDINCNLFGAFGGCW